MSSLIGYECNNKDIVFIRLRENLARWPNPFIDRVDAIPARNILGSYYNETNILDLLDRGDLRTLGCLTTRERLARAECVSEGNNGPSMVRSVKEFREIGHRENRTLFLFRDRHWHVVEHPSQNRFVRMRIWGVC